MMFVEASEEDSGGTSYRYILVVERWADASTVGVGAL